MFLSIPTHLPPRRPRVKTPLKSYFMNVDKEDGQLMRHGTLSSRPVVPVVFSLDDK